MPPARSESSSGKYLPPCSTSLMSARSPYTLFVLANITGAWPQRLQDVHGATHVDVEILNRLHEAGRHGHLRREMEHRACVASRISQGTIVTQISNDDRNAVAMTLFQPCEISFDPGPGKRVVNQDLVSIPCESIGQIGADEASPACHQDRPAVTTAGAGQGVVDRTGTACEKPCCKARMTFAVVQPARQVVVL